MKHFFELFIVIAINILLVFSEGPCFPKQIHLSLGDSYSEGITASDSSSQNYQSRNENNLRGAALTPMSLGEDTAKIIWVTLDTCNGSTLQISRVKPSAKPEVYLPRTEKFSQYIDLIVDKAHAEGQYTRYSQTAELYSLEYNTMYTALVNSSDGSTSFNFKLPDPNVSEKPLKMLFYADIDVGNTSHPTVSRLQSIFSDENNDINMTFFGGDLAYEIVSDLGIKGDVFFDTFQPFWTTRPMMATAGNHESFYNFSFFNYRMKMPLYDQTNNHYYSWNLGSTHFLAFNFDFYENSSDIQAQERMYKWIENDLKVANSTENRINRPWIIAFTHRPIYCSLNFVGKKEPDSCYNIYAKRRIWDELLSKYHVDLHISGHIHSYERLVALAENKSIPYQKSSDASGVEVILNPSAPIYVVDGSGGNDYFFDPNAYQKGNNSVIVDGHVGLSTLTIYNSSVIGWQHIKSIEGSTIDEFYLKRDRVPPLSSENVNPIIPGALLFLVLAGVFSFLNKKEDKREVQGESSPGKKGRAENIQLVDLNQNNLPLKESPSP